MNARFKHTYGCQSCGAHPDNPRNQTPKLLGCRDCKSFTCQKHLARPRACPRCNGKRLYVAVRYNAQNFKSKGGVGDIPKRGLFGTAPPPNPKNKERADKAANVATEIIKGVGSGVVEALKVLSESNPKANLPRPEDGTTIEELQNNAHMADGLNSEMFDDAPAQNTPNLGLVNEEDPLHLLTLLSENTLSEAEFTDATNKKPIFSTDSYIFAPSLFEAEKMSTELRQYNDKNQQKLIAILALEVDPSEPEVAKRFCQLLEDNPYLFGSIGINPKHAKQPKDHIDKHLTNNLNRQEKIIAIGPVGFDLHYAPHGEKEQGAMLNLIKEIAADFELPMFLSQKNAAQNLATFIQNTPNIKLILTQTQQNITQTSNLYNLVTIEVKNKEQALNFSKTSKLLGHSRILLASGHRSVVLEDNDFQRNKSEFTLETLHIAKNILKSNDIKSLHHKLNANFLQLFHPDIKEDIE